jgi:hypothetical protein
MIIYINNNVDPVVVGQTGIYELNIEGGSSIYSLAFDYKMLTMINESPSAYLIIDYISEAGG